eukprot:gene7104-5110_t
MFSFFEYDYSGVSARIVPLGNLRNTALYVDSAGGVYIGSQSSGAAVYRIYNDTIFRFAGTGSSGVGNSNIMATSTKIRAVNGIVGDTAGNVYLSYSGGLRVVYPDAKQAFRPMVVWRLILRGVYSLRIRVVPG